MFGFGRMKKVTDPLDDRVKARLVGRDPGELGCMSSGSEHSVQTDGDDSSPSFSDLLFCCDDGGSGGGLLESGSDEEGDYFPVCESTHAVGEDAIRMVLLGDADLFRNVLAIHVSKAVELYARLSPSKQIARRNVMAHLRGLGYNAAVCKTKWESSGGLTAGNYEFIDVLRSDLPDRDGDGDGGVTRYFVDLDFAAELQIARPTKHYERLMQSMPRIFVGKSEQLKQILKATSDAARRSLKSRGLHIPPWRKHRFMLNKWLGSYKRTTNLYPSASSAPPCIKCQSVGFDAAVNGHLLRTR